MFFFTFNILFFIPALSLQFVLLPVTGYSPRRNSTNIQSPSNNSHHFHHHNNNNSNWWPLGARKSRNAKFGPFEPNMPAASADQQHDDVPLDHHHPDQNPGVSPPQFGVEQKPLKGLPNRSAALFDVPKALTEQQPHYHPHHDNHQLQHTNNNDSDKGRDSSSSPSSSTSMPSAMTSSTSTPFSSKTSATSSAPTTEVFVSSSSPETASFPRHPSKRKFHHPKLAPKPPPFDPLEASNV